MGIGIKRVHTLKNAFVIKNKKGWSGPWSYVHIQKEIKLWLLYRAQLRLCRTHPNVTNKLLGGCFNGNFAVNDSLDGRGPAHGFIQQLGVEVV